MPGSRPCTSNASARIHGRCASSRLALTSFHLGDDTTAVRELARALDAAAELGHEYTDVYVRMFAAWYFADSGQPEAAAEVVRRRCRRQRANSTAAVARAQFAGWALTAGGDPDGRHPPAARGAANRPPPRPADVRAVRPAPPGAAAGWPAGDAAGALDDARAALVIATAEMPFHVPEATRLVGELELATGGDPARALARLDAAAAEAAATRRARPRDPGPDVGAPGGPDARAGVGGRAGADPRRALRRAAGGRRSGRRRQRRGRRSASRPALRDQPDRADPEGQDDGGGGRSGIRTHGGPKDLNGFRGRPIRPLWHPSGAARYRRDPRMTSAVRRRTPAADRRTRQPGCHP